MMSVGLSVCPSVCPDFLGKWSTINAPAQNLSIKRLFFRLSQSDPSFYDFNTSGGTGIYEQYLGQISLGRGPQNRVVISSKIPKSIPFTPLVIADICNHKAYALEVVN